MSRARHEKVTLPKGWWDKLVHRYQSWGYRTLEDFCRDKPNLSARTIYDTRKKNGEITERSLDQLALQLGYGTRKELLEAWTEADETENADPGVAAEADPKSGPEHPAKTPEIPQSIRDAISRGVDSFNTGHFNEAKNEFQQAVTEAERVGHGLGIVDAKEHLALVLTHLDRDAAGAKALLISCLDILAKEDNDKERAEVLQRLAGVHEQEGDLELSESLQRQSLGISEKLGDKQGQAAALVSLGWTVGRGGRTDEALQLNRKAYELLTQVLHEVKQDDTRRIEFIHTILGNLFFQRAKVHQRRAEPDEAEKALGEALEWQRKVPPNHELAKLLRELAELKFFRRKLDEGVSLLQQAATLYQERAMLPEFAECLHIMGRVHASVGNLQKAGEFFSGAASAAVKSGRNQQAAEMLLTLAHLAMEQQDMNAAREFLENAKSASTEGDFQAKCVMELSRLAAKQGDAEERQRLVEEAVKLLKTNLATKKPAQERAKQYFTLGWYLREAGQLEEALNSVRKAHERFELAGDAFGAAKASFEAAGLLDHMGRKKEARELCLTLLQIVERKPFFEIAAGVNLSLARFALHEDKNIAEASRFLDNGLKLCKEHELPLLPEAVLLKDELENVKRAGTETDATIPDLLDFLHQELVQCPANREGYTRFWAFSHARKLGSALRGALGPNIAVFTDDLDEFLKLSDLFKPYRDWSLIVPPQKYPENILEVIPIADKMLVPSDVAMLAVRRVEDNASPDRTDPTDPATFWQNIRVSPEIRAEIGLSYLSAGGSLPRYYFVPLGDQADQYGGAKAGVHGESLALPPQVHELLQDKDPQELKANRLFFIYYNRGLTEEARRFWYDLAILHSYRCFPVYRGALPQSQEVRVVASHSVKLPILDDQSAEKHKKMLRTVRMAFLEVLAANESTSAVKLFDLAAVAEDLADTVGGELIPLTFYVLTFDYEGTTKTHPAIVLPVHPLRVAPSEESK